MHVIDKNIDKIITLCEKYKVARLFMLGSILNDSFKKTSDIDLLVDFSEVELYDYADNSFDFKNSLEAILKGRIDLLENKANNNPYLRKSIDSSKQLIYG